MQNQNSNREEIVQTKPQIATLEINAIEQHKRHLPVATDRTRLHTNNTGVTRELDAFLLPAIPFCTSECHVSMPAVVPEMLSEVVKENLVEEAIHNI